MHDEVRQFSVSGVLRDLVDMRRLHATPCDVSPVQLDKGPADLDALPTASPFTIESVLLASPSTDLAPPARPTRDVSVEDWGASKRTVDLGGRAPGYLMISENHNEGWEATLEGADLQSVVLDGWEQGFRIPRSSHGEVSLTFEPNTLYRWSLVLAAVLALLVFLGALLPARSREEEPLGAADWHEVVWWIVAITIAVAIGGLAVASVAADRARRRVACTGSPLRSAVPSFALAAIAAAVAPGEGFGDWGPQGGVATVLTVVALMALVGTLLLDTTPPDDASATPEVEQEHEALR